MGHPWYEENEIYNALSFFYQGKLLARYFKQELPNYGVFDEPRYFTAAEKRAWWNSKVISSVY